MIRRMPIAQRAAEFEGLYKMRNHDEVVRFVEKNPFLAPLLSEARPQIQKHFPAAEAFLQFVVDPEIPDYEELVVSIATDLGSGEAVRRLLQLGDDWWFGSLQRAQGKLCITLEFR